MSSEDDNDQVTISRTWGTKGYLESSVLSPDLTVCIVGDERTGKTCLAHTLAGKEYTEIRHSWYYPEEMEVNITHTINWKVLTEQDKIDDLLKQMIQESKCCATRQIKAKKKEALKHPPTFFAPTYLEHKEGEYLLPVPEFCQFTGVTEKYNPDKTYVTIWDCDGSKMFHAFESLLISPDMVCVIAFDASKLQERKEDEVGSAKAVVKGVCKWMELISSRMYKKTTSDGALSEFYPTFMFVGTKLDMMGMDMKEAKEFAYEKMLSLLRLELANKPYAKFIVGSKNGRLLFDDNPCIFLLSNLSEKRDPEVISAIQKLVMQAAPPRVVRPTWYTRFERELMMYACRKRKPPPPPKQYSRWSYSYDKPTIFTPSLAPMADVEEIASECGVTDKEEILKALEHFHCRGIFLHYSDVPCLSKALIVHHRWFTKLIIYILSNLRSHPAGMPMGMFAQERTENGFFYQELLDWCLDTFKSNEKRHGESLMDVDGREIMQLFSKFHLAMDATETSLVNRRSEDYKAGATFYYMPYFLAPEPIRTPNPDSNLLLFRFHSGFISDVLLHKLILKIGEWSKSIPECECIKSCFDFLYMKLGNHQAYHFRTLSDEPGIIRLTILPWSEQDTSAERLAFLDCNRLIASMRQLMNDLMPELVTDAGVTCAVDCFLPCPKCDNLHIKIERVAMYGYIYCPYNRCHVNMTKYWKLLSTGQAAEDLTFRGPQRPKTIPAFATLITLEPTMKQLHKLVVPKIVSNWREIAGFLDYTSPTISAIHESCDEDEWDCCVEMLRDWLSTDNGCAPKVWHTLMERMKLSSRYHAIVNEIEKALKKLSEK